MPSRILIVEDEQVILELLRRQIVAEGHEAFTAADGEQGLQILRDEDPDVMLVDVVLPGISGMDVLRAARKESPGTEVVVMTANASVQMAIECLRAGAVDLLRKPFHQEQLSAALKAAVERQREHATRGLLKASEAVFAANEPDRLPEVIVRTATEAMGCTGSLLLPGGDGRLYVAYSAGLAPDIQATVSIAIGEKVAGRVALDRKPVLLQDLAEDPRFAGLEPSPRVCSSIVYPLAVGERLLGVLSLNRGAGETRFRRADLQRAAMLASMVQLALENAHLVRKTVASERLASLGTIASSITHEINNPLTYVLCNLERAGELLRKDTPPSAQELTELISDAVNGAERIGLIVRDMRTIARSGQPEQENVFDFSDAVRSALRLAGAVLRSCAEVDLHLAEGARVRGSAGQLTQVLVNLLVNAAHAIREGNVDDGRVTVSTRCEGDQVVAEVADNGRGIAEKDRVRLFEPFFTTRGSTTGTGLGLWISREIVKRHKGNVEVVAASGRGALFRLRLPSAGAIAAKSAGLAPGERRPRVLFVDDEDAILRIYKRVFEPIFELELAPGGHEAWELLQGGARFDAVVCDLMMPGLNGMDLYERLARANPDLARTFLFVTGSACHPKVSSFLASCSNPVLEKPVTMAVVRDAIAKLLRQGQSP